MLTNSRFVVSVIICLILAVVSAVAAAQHTGSTSGGESGVRSLLATWFKAYQNRDAHKLTELETTDVEVVDRFGTPHRGKSENEQLWRDTLSVISPDSEAPEVKFDDVRFLRSDVAIAEVSLQYQRGILLVDGERLPPFSEVDTFVVVKARSGWLVAAHNVHRSEP